MKDSSGILLAGDLGATKTTLALYEAASWSHLHHPLQQQTFQNAAFADFDSLLHTFLGPGQTEQTTPTRACLSVAGPVLANTVSMTNRNWSIKATELQTRFNFRQVNLINDLVATALGSLHVEPQDLHVLNSGEQREKATRAILAPGSGLGEAFLLPHNNTYLPQPSEGGHASFAPRNEEQMDLLTFMRQQYDHVSVEQVCSGLAIPQLMAFLATREPIPGSLQSELHQAIDQTPIIIQAAIKAIRGEQACDIAVHTLQLFLDILADEAANLVLKTLALGGIFLGGGLAARLLPLIDPQRFMTTFTRGIYRDMLASIPVSVITNAQTALLGAAAFGIDSLQCDPPFFAPS